MALSAGPHLRHGLALRRPDGVSDPDGWRCLSHAEEAGARARPCSRIVLSCTVYAPRTRLRVSRSSLEWKVVALVGRVGISRVQR